MTTYQYEYDLPDGFAYRFYVESAAPIEARGFRFLQKSPNKSHARRIDDWWTLDEKPKPNAPRNVFYRPTGSLHQRFGHLAHHIVYLMFVAHRMGRLTPEILDGLLIDTGALHEAIHRAQIDEADSLISLERLLEKVRELEDLVPELFEEAASDV